MLNTLSKPTSGSLLTDYASLLGDAVLRNNARQAEHAARIETDIANRIKSEFIANMSHELRTPLNTMLGFSKLLREHDDKQLSADEIVQYAGLIHDAAGHLLSVINDILDITKLQSGRYTIEAQELQPIELIDGVIDEQKPNAEHAGVGVNYEADRGIDHIRGDWNKLRQAFNNLLNNAIKFTPAGGSVSVEARRRRDGGVVVIIRDTGVGMSDDEIRIALADFGQVDGSRTRWRDGTGLGLPIAKALIELHGGELSIRSEKDVGTEVAVLLPPKSRVSLAAARDHILGKGAP
ncbi:MAG: HAMP domain-containing sensor histidine kinase [Pseudomonadota bacterium]